MKGCTKSKQAEMVENPKIIYEMDVKHVSEI